MAGAGDGGHEGAGVVAWETMGGVPDGVEEEDEKLRAVNVWSIDILKKRSLVTLGGGFATYPLSRLECGTPPGGYAAEAYCIRGAAITVIPLGTARAEKKLT